MPGAYVGGGFDPVLVSEPPPPKKLLERTSAEIERAQRRDVVARKGHTQRTHWRLDGFGVKLNEPVWMGIDFILSS